MTLSDAINALNAISKEQIVTGATRDGRVVARLPRVGAEAIIEKSQFNKDVKPTAHDFALICQEARLAMEPAIDLLDAALKAAKKAGKPK